MNTRHAADHLSCESTAELFGMFGDIKQSFTWNEHDAENVDTEDEDEEESRMLQLQPGRRFQLLLDIEDDFVLSRHI